MCIIAINFLSNSLTCVLGAQKHRLIKMVLLSTYNICFGWEIKKIFFSNALLSGGLLCIGETPTFANSEDPDEMQRKAAFRRGLHCL